MTPLYLLARLALLVSLLAPQQQAPADLVLRNAKVYTANDRQPRAEAVAIRGDKIVFVGETPTPTGWSAPIPKSSISGARRSSRLYRRPHAPLRCGRPRDDPQPRGHHQPRGFPGPGQGAGRPGRPGQWVTGRGWIETFWKPPVFPTRQDLDRIAPNNPVAADPGRWPCLDRQQRGAPARGDHPRPPRRLPAERSTRTATASRPEC